MTKYTRQVSSALSFIKRKGVLCTWIKIVNIPGPDPEFPDQDPPTEFPVYIVYIPSDTETRLTVIMNNNTGVPIAQFFGYMGSTKGRFTPEENDQIRMPDGSVKVVQFMNITQPDLEPVLYELGLT